MRISDLSSDVCSSDLSITPCRERATTPDRAWTTSTTPLHGLKGTPVRVVECAGEVGQPGTAWPSRSSAVKVQARCRSSEERRVGKECVSRCRTRWPRSHLKNKKQLTTIAYKIT